MARALQFGAILEEFLRPFEQPHELQRWKYSRNMADTVTAPAQYKQPSRKGKKAWRKNVDITQIQSGLEDVREQVTQGYD